MCLVALMTAIWKRLELEQVMLAATRRTVLCKTLIVIMRQRALPNASIAVVRITTRFSAMLIFLPVLGLESIRS